MLRSGKLTAYILQNAAAKYFRLELQKKNRKFFGCYAEE